MILLRRHLHIQKKISRLAVTNGEMIMSTVTKNKFLQLNDKKFYFPNGVVSLPFHHPPLAKIDELKQKKDRGLKNSFGRK